MRAFLRLAVVTTGLLLPRPMAAQEDAPVTFTGNVAVKSDYTFRGISQTQEEVAIQGGMNGTGPAGLYLGVWGSSLNFAEAAPANRAQAEIDIFGGIGRSVGGASVSVGGTYYAYPGTLEGANYEFFELTGALSRALGPVTPTVSVSWSPDFFAASGSALYLAGMLGVPVGSTPISLTGSLGYQTIETNSAFGTPDYMDFSAGATVNLWGVDFGATFVGTDLDTDDCFGGSELCESRVVLGATLVR